MTEIKIQNGYRRKKLDKKYVHEKYVHFFQAKKCNYEIIINWKILMWKTG